MSGFPDDRYDDRPNDQPDDRDRERDSRDAAIGRAAVGVPGIFLILNGLFGLAICLAFSVPLVFNPELLADWMKNLAAQQPPGQQKQDLEKQAEELDQKINQDRNAYVIQNAAELGVGAVLNLLAIFGGFMMRSLGSYGWSMAGSIVSLIPCATGCCCTGIPFGIWALVVLIRPEVKAAFAAARSSRSNPDEQYMR